MSACRRTLRTRLSAAACSAAAPFRSEALFLRGHFVFRHLVTDAWPAATLFFGLVLSAKDRCGCWSLQEEIRFAICPELIASRLFTEVLLENEVLMVYGPERFCSYQGYGSSFQCAGDFEDEVELDTETGTNSLGHLIALLDASCKCT